MRLPEMGPNRLDIPLTCTRTAILFLLMKFLICSLALRGSHDGKHPLRKLFVEIASKSTKMNACLCSEQFSTVFFALFCSTHLVGRSAPGHSPDSMQSA